jgi:hypothetical protein
MMIYMFSEFSGLEALDSGGYNQLGIEPLHQSSIQPSCNKGNQKKSKRI